MNLQVRDPRAHELARRLADLRKVSMTEAVVDALQAELNRTRQTQPLAHRLATIAADLKGKSAGPGHAMTKDEIDDMWGE